MKILALNTKDQLTYCSVPEEERGKGRCNHVAHQNKDESKKDFIERIDIIRNKQETNTFEGDVKIEPFRLTEEDKTNLTEMKGRKQLSDDTNLGGFIHVEEPLWNDMDKNYFAQISNNTKNGINSVLIGKNLIIIKADEDIKYKVGQIVTEIRAKKIKDQLGDKIEFGTNITSLNEAAKEFNFEATKDISVLPYYMRQDPPEATGGQNAINVLYNYVIYNRKDPIKQQAAYEKLLDNRHNIAPKTQKGGYAMDSLSDLFAGKSGILRKYITGRAIPYSGRGVLDSDISMPYGETKLPCSVACDIFKPTIEDVLTQRGKSKEEIEGFFKKYKGNQTQIPAEDKEYLDEIVRGTGLKVMLNRQPSLHMSSLLTFHPGISPDATIKVNPQNFLGYNGDLDGDVMAVTGLNDLEISDNTSMDSDGIYGTNLPRHKATSINLPSKDSLWGLLNVLNRATPK